MRGIPASRVTGAGSQWLRAEQGSSDIHLSLPATSRESQGNLVSVWGLKAMMDEQPA